MIFSFFKTAEVSEFADSVASEYDRLRRSSAVRRDSPERQSQKFEKLSQKVDSYCRDHRLNFYKKARMIYVIKQGLEEKGVSEPDITAFINNVLAKGLQKKNRRA